MGVLDGLGSTLQGAAALASIPIQMSTANQSAKIANKNFKLAQDAYNYNKQLHVTQMAREDNAIQRRMADLEAAGLHPALAAGDPAAAQPMSQVAAPQRSDEDVKQYGKIGTSLMENMMFQNQLSYTNAQKKLIEAQARKLDAETDTLLPASVGHLDAQRRTEGLRGDLYQAQKKREDLYYTYMPQLHENEKAKADHILKVTEQISHDLQYSKDHHMRTTDHNQWLSLIGYLESALKKIVGEVPNPPEWDLKDTSKVFGGKDAHIQDLFDLYDTYKKFTDGLGMKQMTFDEFRKSGGSWSNVK